MTEHRRSGFALLAFALALLCSLPTAASAQDDISLHRSCSRCGMDRKAYGYSRMLIEYGDGVSVGVCSLHCAVEDLEANPAKPVKVLLVADRDTRELVEAEKAVWVVGGRKRGVMTATPKWAFRSKEAAEAFVEANGGGIVPWTEALGAARAELAP